MTSFHRSMMSRRKGAFVEGEDLQEAFRMRSASPLCVGPVTGTWVGRLESKSKLRVLWKIAFGPQGRQHTIICTMSRKSKKREIFFDGDLIHSGALGLLESVSGVAADMTLFEHKWNLSGRSFCIAERVFAREGVIISSSDADDPAEAAACRETARFELFIDGDLFESLRDLNDMSFTEKISVEDSLRQRFFARNVTTGAMNRDVRPESEKLPAAATLGARDVEDAHAPNRNQPSSGSYVDIRRGERKQRPTATLSGNRETLYSSTSVGESYSHTSNEETMRENTSLPSDSCEINDNGLVSRLRCVLDAGVLGGEISLKNDVSGLRVEIDKATNKAGKCGVAVGDILLSLNGRSLPPKLDAIELTSLLKANPRYMLSRVVACVWRRYIDGGGTYMSPLFGKRTYEMRLARLELSASVKQSHSVSLRGSALSYKDTYHFKHPSSKGSPDINPCTALQGYYVVVHARNAGEDETSCVQPGDVVVGFDFHLLPRFATAVCVAQIAREWSLAGNLTMNILRLSNRTEADRLGRLASSCEEQSISIVAAPGDAGTVKNSGSVWSASNIRINVTGDGKGCENFGRAALSNIPDKKHVAEANVAEYNSKYDEDSEQCMQLACSGKPTTRRHTTPVGPHARPKFLNDSDDLAEIHSVDSKRVASAVGTRFQERSKQTFGKLSIADDRNFAVFKRLLQSGATLDEIVVEMRTAGVAKETVQRIIQSLRSLIAVRASKEKNTHPDSLNRPPASSDPHKSLLAMIEKRGAFTADYTDGSSSAAIDAAPSDKHNLDANIVAHAAMGNDSMDDILHKYRKMVKLGVPAASVFQRMRIDQVDKIVLRTFAAENGLEYVEDENDTTSSGKIPGKRAKLHWDAMTLDDSALAVSVWAADAFGGESEGDADESQGETPAYGNSDGLLDEDDLERLSTLFLNAENSKVPAKTDGARKDDDPDAVLKINGKPILGVRILNPQRSQNISIAIAQLIRGCDDAYSLLCSVARMDASNTTIEQLETLLAAMPTRDEKGMVDKHVNSIASCSNAYELAQIDSALKSDARFIPAQPCGIQRLRGVPSICAAQETLKDSKCSDDQDKRIKSVFMMAVEREELREIVSEESTRLLRIEYVAKSLPAPERFIHAISRVESSLTKLREARLTQDATGIGKPRTFITSLDRRLHALVSVVSATSVANSLAEKADMYGHAARSLVASRDLARLLKHVLAAGNAVNAGSAKGGASAVRLSSLLQAARTKGVDGKTTLLDGVVGLLLDRAARKQQQHYGRARSAKPLELRRGEHQQSCDSKLSDDAYLGDHLLDFPENDGLLASLDSARCADEHLLKQEAAEFSSSVALVSEEIKLVVLEIGPDANDDEDPRDAPERPCSQPSSVGASSFLNEWSVPMHSSVALHLFPSGSSKQQRCVERERLLKVERALIVHRDVLNSGHMIPLQHTVAELRAYFACDKEESLDSIFSTLREFLRAFCDSRNSQRHRRRAQQRDANRRAKATAVRLPKNVEGKRRSAEVEDQTGEGFSIQRCPQSVHNVSQTVSQNANIEDHAKPPSHPPPEGVDAIVARARRYRSSVAAADDDELSRAAELWNEDEDASP